MQSLGHNRMHEFFNRAFSAFFVVGESRRGRGGKKKKKKKKSSSQLVRRE